MERQIKWIDFYTLLFEGAVSRWPERYEYVHTKLLERWKVEDENQNQLRQWVFKYGAFVRKKWDACNRTAARFEVQHKDWLNSCVRFQSKVKGNPEKSNQKDGGGRPRLPFVECTERTKRHRTESLRASTSTDEITYAAEMKLRSEGRFPEANLMRDALRTSPTRVQKMKAALDAAKSQPKLQKFSSAEALALMVEADLSVKSYILIRQSLINKGADLLPSYKKVSAYKKKCYPPIEDVSVSEQSSEISLQGLLDLTANRIVESIDSAIKSLPPAELKEVLMISKAGFDGSSSQINYKQKSENENLDDSKLFMTCLVPLRLVTVSDTVIWQNPRPSSTRYCRPLKLEFTKETTEVILKEKESFDNQSANLTSTKVKVIGCEHMTIKHKVCLTMVDGKTCNALSGTASSQTCYICGATPKLMNNLEKISERPVDKTTFQYGLSTLHAYIRFLEWMLHVSYRLEVQQWRENKTTSGKIKLKKQEVQEKFRSHMGLAVDMVKQGVGTTNDGNTARRFFDNPSLSAEITGIDERLIKRCQVILRTLSCGFAVNTVAFQTFAMETAKLYVDLYPWYYMPAAVHKILVHGAEVISESLLPIGMLSEEALESRNKDFRRFRERRTRKMSRVKTNEDLLNIMLVSSDPVLSSMRPLPQRKSGSISEDVLRLLSPENVSTTHPSDDESD